MSEEIHFPLERIVISVGNISGGVELPTYKIAIITENELFKRQKSRVRKSTTISNAERIKHYQELNVGDYVVHRNHGIGKYIVIESLKVNNLHKDYLLIKYRSEERRVRKE